MFIPKTELKKMAKDMVGKKVLDTDREDIGTIIEAWVEHGSVICRSKVHLGGGKEEIVQCVIYKEMNDI